MRTATATRLRTHNHLDFDEVNAAALDVLPALRRRRLPDGQREGSEHVVSSLRGEPGRSLTIRLTPTAIHLSPGRVGWSDQAIWEWLNERVRFSASAMQEG